MCGAGAEDVAAQDEDAGEFLDSGDDDSSPSGQLITTACWLSLKEAGLILGTLARSLPLAGPLFWLHFL